MGDADTLLHIKRRAAEKERDCGLWVAVQRVLVFRFFVWLVTARTARANVPSVVNVKFGEFFFLFEVAFLIFFVGYFFEWLFFEQIVLFVFQEHSIPLP